MSDDEMTERQRAIEERWRKILLEQPTEENFARAYDEIHRFMLDRGKSEGAVYRGEVSFAGRAIASLVGTGKRVLEIGCGDGSLSFHLASSGNTVVAADVSDLALEVCRSERERRCLCNLEFRHAEATCTECPDSSFDIVVSQDLLEHLPEDVAGAHLKEVFRVLKPGGSYVFWTPSRLYGHTSLGLHLKEYDLRDAISLVERAGFRAVWIDARFYKIGMKVAVPAVFLPMAYAWERILDLLKVERLPKPVKQFLVPPVLIQAVKPTEVR